MLYLRFGVTEKTFISPSRRFFLQFEDEWLEDPLVREMIKDIDKSEVIAGRAIDSPVLGVISPLELSGGVKALILMLFEPEYEYYGTACGDNCAKWILKIAEKNDLNLTFRHIMKFPEPFKITVVNSGKIITTMKELISESIRYLDREEK